MRDPGKIFNAPLRHVGLGKFPLANASARTCKRSFDLLIATLLLVFVFSWLWPLLVLLIKISSPGPVYFRQERWGIGGKPFICYKFRSMIRESRDIDQNGRYQQARRNDWRVTPLGRFLRRNNLDEFAQIVNVLKGEMSFVGPRPHPTSMNLEYMGLIQNYQLRHLVKPGITGWAQINGLRGETSNLELLRRRVEYDVWYIENWSIWLDVKIVLLSIGLMFKGDPRAF
jgi:putative colanic acid biosynthesis UDP-glucose lipid carrier transferase